jgi:hypothetical protein
MTKLTLLAVAVLCAMPTGYRRAGFSLSKGENELQATEEQIQLLVDDENLTVVAESASDTQSDSTMAYTKEMFAKLLAENATLKNQVTALTKLCEGQEESITLLEIEIANPPVITHEDTLADLAGVRVVVDDGEELDVSSAPEELHHWIAVIDDINKEGNLTKKPNCDHLTITVDGESLTPSAAERDAVWSWYQENVVIASAGSTADVNTRETGE